MIHQIIFAFIATYCFGILFNIKTRKLLFTSLAGAIGWATFLLTQRLGESETMAYFFAAISLSVFSEIGARYLKTPVTSILICGLIPLVPGGGMYYTMYHVIQNDSTASFTRGIATLSAAGALAMGIVFTTSMVKAIRNFERDMKKS